MIDLSGNNELVELLGEYKATKSLIENLAATEKNITSKIFDIVGKADHVVCNDVIITQFKSEDKIIADYDAFIQKQIGVSDKKEIEKEIMNMLFTKTVKGRITKKITFQE